MTNDDIVAVEEFFGDEDEHTKRTCQRRKVKTRENILADVKIKMVMRIYGVSKSRALEILAEQDVERKAL